MIGDKTYLGDSVYCQFKGFPQLINCQIRATEHLELTEGQAQRLFYLHNWPIRFQRECVNCDAHQMADVAVRRIHHFINNGL